MTERMTDERFAELKASGSLLLLTEIWFAFCAERAEVDHLTVKTDHLQANMRDAAKVIDKQQTEIEELRAEVEFWKLENERLRGRLSRIETKVNEQAEDESLWFLAADATEAYLQDNLRQLHRVIEEAPEAG